MFENQTTLTEADLKKIAMMLRGEQLFHIIAHHTIHSEQEIAREILTDIENNDPDEILAARKSLSDPEYLAKTSFNIHADMDEFIQDAMKLIAPQYTK